MGRNDNGEILVGYGSNEPLEDAKTDVVELLKQQTTDELERERVEFRAELIEFYREHAANGWDGFKPHKLNIRRSFDSRDSRLTRLAFGYWLGMVAASVAMITADNQAVWRIAALVWLLSFFACVFTIVRRNKKTRQTIERAGCTRTKEQNLMLTSEYELIDTETRWAKVVQLTGELTPKQMKTVRKIMADNPPASTS